MKLAKEKIEIQVRHELDCWFCMISARVQFYIVALTSNPSYKPIAFIPFTLKFSQNLFSKKKAQKKEKQKRDEWKETYQKYVHVRELVRLCSSSWLTRNYCCCDNWWFRNRGCQRRPKWRHRVDRSGWVRVGCVKRKKICFYLISFSTF